MKACFRVLLLLLLVLGLALPWIARSRWHPDWKRSMGAGALEIGAGSTAELNRPHQLSERRAAGVDAMFTPVPESVWMDREAALDEDALQALRDCLADAELTPADLRRERARLASWLDSQRADTVADLVGGWHGLRRLLDRDVEREYEVNRRKRKLLDQLLADLSD